MKHLPNFITLLNVLCGSIAAVFAAVNHLELAALFFVLGVLFDFFDGLAARALHVKSELGVQLDSLADMVTSGLVPGIVMFQLLNMSIKGGWNYGGLEAGATWLGVSVHPVAFMGFLITMASAYRLAKFNIDENQVSSFVGLPTPANALMIVSLPLIMLYQGNDVLNGILLDPWFLVGLTLLSSYLLNANISLFALKFKNWSFKDNSLRYVFIIVSGILLITFQYLAIPLIILFYIASSVLDGIRTNK